MVVPPTCIALTTRHRLRVALSTLELTPLHGHVPLPRGIVAHASYSYQDARDDSGRSLTNSPRHLGQAGVTAPLAFGLEAAAELIIVGPRRALDRRRLEAARILNLNLRYRTPIRHLGLTAGFYNVFDQTYPDPAGAEHLQDRIPQDGLTFRVQLTYEF